jgi:hypothetical protein
LLWAFRFQPKEDKQASIAGLPGYRLKTKSFLQNQVINAGFPGGAINIKGLGAH